nr:putative reverse transcriptase domain-containing protein [Tanacetum cinerariifolium]
CQPVAQNIDFSGSDQIQTLQYPDVHPLSQETSDEVFQANHSIQNKETFENSFEEITVSNPNKEKEEPPQDSEIHQHIIEECCVQASEEQKQSMEDTMLELVKICQEKSFFEVKNIAEQPAEHGNRSIQSLQNFRVVHKNSISLNNTSQISSIHAVTSVLSIKEPEHLLSMGYEHLSITPEMKSNEEVKNIAEQPAEHGNHSIQSLQNFRVVHKNSISLNNTSQISSIHAVTPVLSIKEPEHLLSMGYEHLSITPEMKSNEVTESNAENLLPIPSEYEVTLEDKRECNFPISENSPIYDNHSNTFSESKSMMIFQFMTMILKISKEEIDLEDISQIQDVVLREKLLSITRLISNIESSNENSTPDHVLNSFESNNSFSDNFSLEFETFCDHLEETRSGNTTHVDNSLPEYDSFCFKIEPDQERLINLVKNDIPDNFSNDPLLEEVDLFLAFDNSIPPGMENFADDPEEPPDVETDVGEEIPVVMNEKDEDVDYSYFIFVIYPEMFPLLLSAESEDAIFDPDLQLGVESYQKKLNLTKPDMYRSDLKHKKAYTAYSNPRGFIYQNKDKQNRLMRIDELHKFSDGTLNDLSIHEEEAKDEESFDPIVQTPKNSDDEGNDDASLGLNVGGKEGQDAVDDDKELYRDVNINMEGRDSSSVSSQFVTSMLNPSPDAGIDSLFETTLRVDVQASTKVAPLTLTAPTLPPLIIPTISQTLEANFSEFVQANQFAGAVSFILGIVERYMDQWMNEAVKVAVQIQSDRLRDKAQAKNEAFLNNLDENIQKIIKDQVKEQVKFETRAADDQPIAEASQHPESFPQQKKPPTPDCAWNKTLPATHRSIQPWISDLAKQADSRSSFNELMDTHVDFLAFLMNRLKVDTLTPKLLAGPTYDLIKGSCKSLVELEFFLEEVYKTKAADYGHIKLIEDLVPRTMWSQEPVGYDKYALWGISYWGRKRQQFYEFAVNRESARDVYSKRRIIVVTELQIVEWHDYKHLDWITVRRDDDKLYKFKEGDFKRLHIQDIKDMLLLLVQGKLTNLTVEDCFAFNVSLRMFTRSIVIQRRVKDLQLEPEGSTQGYPLVSVEVLRYDKRSKSENMGMLLTEMELILEYSQQGISHEVLARSWSILTEDPYEEAARQALEQAPPTPEYMHDLMELEDHVPVCENPAGFRLLKFVGTRGVDQSLYGNVRTSLGANKLCGIHDTFHVSNLKRCFVNDDVVIPLDKVQLDDKLHFVGEPVKIMDREVKQLKQSWISIVKVRWNSRRGPEFIWEREDFFRSKYPHLLARRRVTRQCKRRDVAS